MLGEATAYMTLIESALELAIVSLIVPEGGAIEPMLAVLAGQQAAALIDMFRRVGPMVDPERANDIEGVAYLLQGANERRNQVVHTVWLWGVENADGGRAVMGQRRRRSGRGPIGPTTSEELRQTRDAVRDAREALLDLLAGMYGVDLDDDRL